MKPLNLALAVSVTLLSACDSRAPDYPHISDVSWHRVNHSEIGLSLELPERFVQDVSADRTDKPDRLIYRLDGYPVLSLSLLSKAEAAAQGLWAGHESYGSRPLEERDSSLYRYDHCDGFFCMATHAMVVEHGGRYLAIEFRSGQHLFSPLEEHIINSMTLN